MEIPTAAEGPLVTCDEATLERPGAPAAVLQSVLAAWGAPEHPPQHAPGIICAGSHSVISDLIDVFAHLKRCSYLHWQVWSDSYHIVYCTSSRHLVRKALIDAQCIPGNAHRAAVYR